MVIVLSLNYRYGKTAAPIQNIIGKLGAFLITMDDVIVNGEVIKSTTDTTD